MSAHTPGPWAIADDDKKFVYALGPAGTNKFWCPVQASGPEKIGRDEAEANARLIAAAPELLEALGKMVKRIEYYSALGETNQVNIEQWEYTEGSSDMERARAAIAKANGEQA